VEVGGATRSESRARGGTTMYPPGALVGGVGRTRPLSGVVVRAGRGVVAAGVVRRGVGGAGGAESRPVESRPVESRRVVSAAESAAGTGATVAGAVSVAGASSPLGVQALPARAAANSRGTIGDGRDSGRIGAPA
jgi:hypothetical protein